MYFLEQVEVSVSVSWLCFQECELFVVNIMVIVDIMVIVEAHYGRADLLHRLRSLWQSYSFLVLGVA